MRTRDDAALAAEVDQIRSVPGVRAAEVFRSVSTVRDKHAVVRELGEVSLDDIDWRLLHELQRDGRAPYTRLAHVIGLSQAATRARVVRLMRTGVIQVTGLADPLALGAAELGGFGLVVTGGLRKVAEAVAAQDGVRYLATGFGRYDIVGQAEAASRAELVAVLDAIRSVPGATVRESWHHLDVVKESYAVELPEQPLAGRPDRPRRLGHGARRGRGGTLVAVERDLLQVQLVHDAGQHLVVDAPLVPHPDEHLPLGPQHLPPQPPVRRRRHLLALGPVPPPSRSHARSCRCSASCRSRSTTDSSSRSAAFSSSSRSSAARAAACWAASATVSV